MHRSIIFTSLAALALVGASTVASADSDERPFEGTIKGHVGVAPAPDCPLGIMTVSDGEGTLTHLGRTVMHSEHCTPADAFNPYGEMTLVAANGDRIEIEYNDFAPYPSPTDTVIHGEGDLLIVGGTGRFENASGGALDQDWTTHNFVVELEFPGYMPDGSFPPGPFDTVWEFGPMSIAY